MKKPTLAQRIVESDFFLRIYETRWFRQGPLLYLIAGLTFQREYGIISEALGLARCARILDLGCGSGIYTRPLAREITAGSVVGLDAGSSVITHARHQADREGIQNAAFVRANALSLPFPDETFDGVLSCATLHLFSMADLQAVFQEVYRVLKPGGRFATSCLRQIVPGQRARQWSEAWHSRTGTNYHRPEYWIPLLEHAGFVEIRCLHQCLYWMLMKAEKPASTESS